jgi:hypothetical protein
MKILLIGHSGTLGRGIPERSQRPAAMLNDLLLRHFPDKPVEIDVEGWNFLTPDRIDELVDLIGEQQPDYLILQPSTAWVVMPVVEQAIRRRLPVAFHGLLHKWARANYRVEKKMLFSAWPQLFNFYHGLVSSLGYRIFGAEPLYTIPQILTFLDRLLSAAKRREDMDVLVLGRTPWRHKPELERRNSNYHETLAELDSGMAAMCRRHAVTLVELQSSANMQELSEDGGTLKYEGLHSTPEFKQRWVSKVANTIRDLEYAYR